jgi:hypothetical protein
VGLQLPTELVPVLGVLGFTWPQADEEQLFHLAQRWMDLSGRLQGHVEQADADAQPVWWTNVGDTISSFRSVWTAADGPSQQLTMGATGAQIIGAGLMICAGVVLALKINVITQLVILAIQIAQAIATAAVTFGASLLEIPIFRAITKVLLDQLLGLAIDAVLNA